jgi:hypothetical protein
VSCSTPGPARDPEEPVERRLGARGVEQRLTGRDASHAVDQVATTQLLEYVAGDARHDGVEQRLVVANEAA